MRISREAREFAKQFVAAWPQNEKHPRAETYVAEAFQAGIAHERAAAKSLEKLALRASGPTLSLEVRE